MTEQELEAGVLMFLFCIADIPMRSYKPRIILPHCGMLPTEEILSENLDGIAHDLTMTCSGRPWLILK